MIWHPVYQTFEERNVIEKFVWDVSFGFVMESIEALDLLTKLHRKWFYLQFWHAFIIMSSLCMEAYEHARFSQGNSTVMKWFQSQFSISYDLHSIIIWKFLSCKHNKGVRKILGCESMSPCSYPLGLGWCFSNHGGFSKWSKVSNTIPGELIWPQTSELKLLLGTNLDWNLQIKC